jgi:hypothetical protein
MFATDYKGWFSDESCGAGNASSDKDRRECAERCIKNGAQPVFVTEGDGKIFKVAGNVKALDHIMNKVKVSGTLKGDTLTITKVEKTD